MFVRRLVALLVLLAVPCFAQDWAKVHKTDDARLAKETGLDPATVHKLWRMASRYPNEKDDESRISSLDMDRLASRHHVLLITYTGEHNCMTLTVFQRVGESDFSKVWWANLTPDGHGFCDAEMGTAEVRVTEDGDIVVRVPTFLPREDGSSTLYTYKWNGVTYAFAGQSGLPAGESSSSQ